ncbi:LysR substrate-binding domain-containing protein [Amycolatopsis pithecellobii]|uniref:LysR family transcriptional regulator n=1 Tax=Amycolatopsis pithecellobii TaxID=664692 RepID=A0A6N7YMS2_9PSEU|nr:LysR substrate-binding domain-containing protein [Amycolatopsis pithecellobii]MTD53312.1 LysR family transcriptional regulator [Amycolatopsis pithecellobii]
MKLQQLHYVLEIVNHGNHLSAAAEALHTSQPGISRQLQLLESELGFDIFARSRNRIEGLTEPGELVVDLARRIMSDVAALSSLKADLQATDRGTLTIATTHTQANYVLPKVIGPFVADFPDVQVVLKQGDPEGICALVQAGEADLAIGTESLHSFPDLVNLSCFALPRVVVAPAGHPILDAPELTLQRIAEYPIISYDSRFSGHWKVRTAFERAGLEPKVVLSAIDAGVCKTYVKMGLGLAILTKITFDPEQDNGLRALDADHLFESSTTCIKLRRNIYLRPYLLEFIHRFASRLTPDIVREILRQASGK